MSKHERYDRVLDALSEGVLVHDGDGRIIDSNIAARTLLDVTAAELNGRTFTHPGWRAVHEDGSVVHPSEHPAMRTISSGQPTENTVMGVYRPDQTLVWLQVSSRPVRPAAGELRPVVVSSFRDITSWRADQSKAARLARFYATRVKTCHAIARIEDRDELLQAVCEAALTEGRLRMAWIGFTDSSGRPQPAAWAGVERGYLDRVSISVHGAAPEGQGPTGRALRTGEPHVSHDIATDPRMAPWRAEALARNFRSSAAFPLKVGGAIIGAFTVYAGEIQVFDEEEVRLLAGVAEDLSFALEARETAVREQIAERARRASEERFQTSVETLPDGFETYSAIRDDTGQVVDFRIDYLNRAACELHGHPRQALVGRRLLDVLPGHRRAGLFKDFCELLASDGLLVREAVDYADRGSDDLPALVLDVRAARFGDGLLATFRDVTERERTAATLRASEDRYRTIVETAHEGIWAVDAEGKTTFANRAMAAMLGLARDELLNRSFLDFMDEDAKAQAAANIQRRKIGVAEYVDARLTRDDGNEIFAIVATTPLVAADGTYQGSISMVSDITARKRAEDDLRVAERRWRALVQNSADIIAVIGEDGTVGYASPAVETVLGYSPSEIVGRAVLSLAEDMDVPKMASILDHAFGQESPTRFELQVRHRDGTQRWIELTANNLGQDPAIRGMVFNARDVTDRRAFQTQLQHDALHDPLTDLPNRALLLDRLEHLLAGERRSGLAAGVIFIDLDRFKLINDSWGHQVGDEVLIAVAKRISASVRPGDTVGRLGGDEFVVICEVPGGEQETLAVADRVRSAIEEPLTLSTGGIHLTASAGVATSDRYSASELLAAADAAMYRAKELGKSRTEIFVAEMREIASARLDLESELDAAIKKEAFSIVYQPIVEVASQRLLGFEALLRWPHPRRGMINPADFIPLAEDTGQIVPLGDWVLRQATQQLGRWQRKYGRDDLHVAVNLSTRQLLAAGLTDRVAEYVAAAAIQPENLVLEITETSIMDRIDVSARVIATLKMTQFRIAVDDFGTGYASLGYLKQLDLDILKIDRTFVEGLGTDPRDTAIVSAINLLGGALSLQVIAEGVETRLQLEHLRTLGCDAAQGYLFSRPVLPEVIEHRFLA